MKEPVKNTMRIYYPNGQHEVINNVTIDDYGNNILTFRNTEPPVIHAGKIVKPQRTFVNITSLPFWFREWREEEK